MTYLTTLSVELVNNEMEKISCEVRTEFLYTTYYLEVWSWKC
jgi:hypothetical protein